MKFFLLGFLVLAACSKIDSDSNVPFVCNETISESNGKDAVLVIGDSITIGYFPYVKQALEARYDVIHNPCNAGNTTYLLNHLNEWLSSRPHFKAVIFDVGLHDLYSKEWNTKETFEANLREIGRILKEHADVVVYQNMTQVIGSTPGDFVIGQVVPWNQAAANIMADLSIPVVDLYSVSLGLQHDKTGSPHYNEDGYQTLANAILQGVNL